MIPFDGTFTTNKLHQPDSQFCSTHEVKGSNRATVLPSFPLDDRFILKQIKSVEISFFEQFAPHYFEHVNRALEEKVR